MAKKYKTDILGHQYITESDEETLGHQEYCYVFTIPFKQRTEASCNCPSKEFYKSNFVKNRATKPAQ